MNKIVKKRLIKTIICFVLGAVCGVCSLLNGENMSEELQSYLNGFTTGIFTAGMYFLLCTIRAIRNPKIAKNMENVEQDERLHSINNKALAITFRISVFVEAIVSVLGAILGYMQISECLGAVIGVQLILYIIVYYVIEHKN